MTSVPERLLLIPLLTLTTVLGCGTLLRGPKRLPRINNTRYPEWLGQNEDHYNQHIYHQEIRALSIVAASEIRRREATISRAS
ncbi:hypothetical protein KIN20_007183 [Parelaphostrongylus tenuis]|uniref:Uncharacterized protein n=1 Tax=Parelaphostrongylus tenuis TaxID=148309 RepID=A0AAD5M2Y4_PARTN|nr:hypothetical protein KIN20_007183 [Parelaphostrongylus tenuis]